MNKILPAALKPISDENFGYTQARHLLWRAGFGGSPEQIQTLATWGPEKAVDHLINFEKIPVEPVREDAFDSGIMKPLTDEQRRRFRLARKNQQEDVLDLFRKARQERQRTDRKQMRKIQRWWLTRMIESPRPLEEKMTLFWHGHFATSYRTIENSYHMYMQNQLYRSYALGNYGNLLYRIIRDPAMIAYLDNNDSRKGKPNENLAREIMELFSLGIGNYSEDDIKNGARALTGYTFVDDSFVFRDRDHDKGSKNILGRSGPLDGDDFVSAILETRACSRHMTRKLYAFFAADLPAGKADNDTERALHDMASTFLRSKYNIAPVLKKLFLSEHFYSPAIMNQQIKSPVQLIIGAIRSLQTPVRDLSILLDAMDLMGQSIFFPPSVKGWDGGRSWINTSTLFVRQNTLNYLLTGKKPHGYDALASAEEYDPTPLISALGQISPGAQQDPQAVADYLLRFTLGQSPTHARRTLVNFTQSNSGQISPDMITGILLLISAMPEYQLC